MEQKMTPMVSVIMPAYNAGRYISAAIASVLAQTYGGGVELLVIDDASADDTLAQAQQYATDRRVRIFSQPRNKGVAAARNLGIKKANGAYVAFLDADDWWEPDKLARQMECIARTGAVLCATGRELMQPDGAPTGHIIPVPERITYRQMLHTNVIPCASVVLRRDVAAQFGFTHDEYHEDYILWMNVLRAYGAAAGVNYPGLKCRLSAGGKSRNKLKSARMQYGSYRYLGYGVLRSFYYMVFYTIYGVLKYAGI